MSPLPEGYKCHCNQPIMKKEMGEDSGLCARCNGVLDENLYEMRLRQYQPGMGEYETVDQFLRENDPNYEVVANKAF